MIQDALAQLLDGNDLSRADAREVMDTIMSGEATPAQIGGFLVALRTVRMQDGRAYLQAGGGIVADSDPTDEHQECLNKLAAIEAAIDAAEAAS